MRILPKKLSLSQAGCSTSCMHTSKCIHIYCLAPLSAFRPLPSSNSKLKSNLRHTPKVPCSAIAHLNPALSVLLHVKLYIFSSYQPSNSRIVIIQVYKRLVYVYFVLIFTSSSIRQFVKSLELSILETIAWWC